MIGNFFVAKSCFLRLLSEVVLIGFFFILLSYLKPLAVLSKLAKKDNLALLLVNVGICSLIDFPLTTSCLNYIFFIFKSFELFAN